LGGSRLLETGELKAKSWQRGEESWKKYEVIGEEGGRSRRINER